MDSKQYAPGTVAVATVRGEPAWVAASTGGLYSWLAIDAVKVLSEGVAQ